MKMVHFSSTLRLPLYFSLYLTIPLPWKLPPKSTHHQAPTLVRLSIENAAPKLPSSNLKTSSQQKATWKQRAAKALMTRG